VECININGTKLYWIDTPWDENFFSLKTIEILKIENENQENLVKCLKQLVAISNGELFYGRFKSSSQRIKKAFYASSYYVAEVSASVSLFRLQRYKLPDIYTNRLLRLDSLSDSDSEYIKKHIGESFRYSRFHEDPNIDDSICDARMSGWVGDLIQNETKCMVYKSHNKLHSFMFYSISSNEVSLILGGSLKGSEFHAPFFWASVLDQFQRLGFEKIRTRISLSNLGVLSLYQNLGFKISDVKYDYHRLRRK